MKLLFCTLLLAVPARWGGALNGVVALPNPGQFNAMVRDSAGNVYLGGSATVVKLAPAGSLLYEVEVAPDNPANEVTGLALAPDGTLLAVGLEEGAFPVTPNAAEPMPAGYRTGFFARLGPDGSVIYASYLNAVYGFQSNPAIAVDSGGSAYVTARDPLTSPGYVTVKLDPSGQQVWATGAIGGTLIAVDTQGFVYIAGAQLGSDPLPVTSGAFQSTADHLNFCFAGEVIGYPCPHQYIAKLDPSGASLIYCTWLSGTFGANPSSLLVDPSGNVLLAGTTQSSDYPVTAAAFQKSNIATLPTHGVFSGGACCVAWGPAFTGYVTKLNAAGTGLVFSTYLGGSNQDSIDAAGFDASGNVYLAGSSSSPDFPGIQGAGNCYPSVAYHEPFVARLSADGSSIAGTQFVYGLLFAPTLDAIAEGGPDPSALAAFDGHGSAAVAFNGFLANLNLFGRGQNFACATDAAGHAPLTQIAPGQLLSLYGTNIGEPAPTSVQPRNGVFPSSLGDGSAVKIHGIPAPILYSSAGQINVQVPYEVAGQTAVKIEVDDPSGNIAGTQEFAVIPSQPSAFASLSSEPCGENNILPDAFPAIARNADGSLNNCANPAAGGSNVTIYVNGLGRALPHMIDGQIAADPAVPLPAQVVVGAGAQFVLAESVPGSVNGVWAVTVSVEPLPWPYVSSAVVYLTVGGVPLRDPISVWVK